MLCSPSCIQNGLKFLKQRNTTFMRTTKRKSYKKKFLHLLRMKPWCKYLGKSILGMLEGGTWCNTFSCLGCGSRPATSTCSSDASVKIAKMQSEIDAPTAQAAEGDALKAQVSEFDTMKELFAFIMANIKGNHVHDLGSPNEVRRSSGSSHDIGMC